jgi:hypothetical protein
MKKTIFGIAILAIIASACAGGCVFSTGAWFKRAFVPPQVTPYPLPCYPQVQGYTPPVIKVYPVHPATGPTPGGQKPVKWKAE